MENINKDIVKLSITRILTTLISTITSMLLARYRSLEEYGTYSQMLVVINLFTSLILLGLPNSINFFLSRSDCDYDRKKFINVYYTLSTILSIILGISLTLSVNIIVKYFKNTLIKSFLYFLALYPWTKIIIGSIENVLVVYKRTKLLFVIKIAHNIIVLILVLLIQYFSIKFSIYMIIFMVIEICFMILDYYIVKHVTGTLKFCIDKQLIKKIFAFSIPIGIASIIGTLNIELDKLLIGKYFSTEYLAIYSACSNELPFNIISSSITSVALPLMIKYIKNGEYEKSIDKWKNTIVVSFSIIVFFSIGMFVFSKDVIRFLYSEKYIEGDKVFKIYSLVLLTRCTYFGMILNSMGKTKFIMISSIITLFINFCLNYLFYYIFGFSGPAYATLFASIIMCLLQLSATSKCINISLKKIFPWDKLLYLLLINVILGFMFYNIKNILSAHFAFNTVIESIFLGMIWGIIYILIVGNKIIKLFKEI